MGFFGALGKIIAGKPVYTAEDVAKQNGMEGSIAAEGGHKTMPNVRFGRVESRLSGQRLDVYAHVENDSQEPIFLDRVFVLGVKRELDSQLRAGEARQMLIYSGPLLMHQPTGFVEVQYRKQSDGDYFANYHQIMSRPVGSEGYEITELREKGPVKDI